MWACEYGTDPHCTTIAICESTDGGHTYTWSVRGPNASCAGNLAGCPAMFDAGAGGVCPVQGTCAYPEGRCACGLCNQDYFCGDRCGPSIDAGPEGGPSTATDWQCATWLVSPGCPNPRPLLGAPCMMEGQTCGSLPCYCDAVDLDPAMTCTDGYWGLAQGGC